MDTPRDFYRAKIQEQIRRDRANCKAKGYRFLARFSDGSEHTAAHHTIGDMVSAVLEIDNAEDARRFYEGYVADIQAQMDAGAWSGHDTAESAARSNIGWCYGEGMDPARIRMWVEATGAAHPVFGTMNPPPTAEEAFAAGLKADQQ